MKARLTAALLLLLVIVQYSSGARLESHTKSRLTFPKVDRVLRSVLQKLINQNNLKGFFVHNLIHREKNPLVKVKAKEFLREVSSLASVTHYSRSADIRYMNKKFMRNYKAGLVHFHVAATDNVYFIVLVNSHQFLKYTQFRKGIILLNYHFSTCQSVTKTLVVPILDKPPLQKIFT